MEDNIYAVEAEHINKCYKIYSGQKQKFLDLILPKGAGKTFYAIKDISFKVEKGDSVGLLGLNGAGKSTLSNMLGGTSLPNSGKLKINGESALIAIGLGMNNFLTGIENIELKAIMMGYKKDEIEKIKQEVIEFADIGDFINQPVRTYSSGMRSRLGFGISIHTNPDILVIDEALSVGDPTFSQKCLDKMNEFRESGKTIFFVSHALPQVKQFCNKAMWLEYGTLKEYGDVEEVLPKYQEYINKINKMSAEEKAEYKKQVLKNQEHSLLGDFKIIDPAIRNVTPEGLLIKTVKLINKKLKVKNVPYNFDYYTFAFGFLPSLFRGRIDIVALILGIEVLNFFIIPMPISILTNFIITLIASVFTGKYYIDYLIEKKGFIPFKIWKTNEQSMYMNKRDRRKLKSKFKRISFKNGVCMVMSVVFIIASMGYAGFIQYRSEIEMIVANKSEAMKIKNLVIVNTTEKDNKKRINNIAVVNTDAITSELKGVVYPGGIQVKTENGYNELRNIADLNDMDGFKKLLKDNLGIIMDEYIVTDSSKFNKGDPTLTSYYIQVFKEFLSAKDSELDKYLTNIENLKMSFNNELIRKFYDEYKGKPDKVLFSTIKYQEIPLSELVEDEILKEVELYDTLKDYKLLVLDRRHVQDSVLIKKIEEEYNKKKNQDEENKTEEDNGNDIDTSNIENIISGDNPVSGNNIGNPNISNPGGGQDSGHDASGGSSQEEGSNPDAGKDPGTESKPPEGNNQGTETKPDEGNNQGTETKPDEGNNQGSVTNPDEGNNQGTITTPEEEVNKGGESGSI